VQPPCALDAVALRSALPRGELVLVDESVVRAAGLDAGILRTQACGIPSARAVLELGLVRLLAGEDDGSVEPLYLFEFGAGTKKAATESVSPRASRSGGG
jgi:hypothetical protein